MSASWLACLHNMAVMLCSAPQPVDLQAAPAEPRGGDGPLSVHAPPALPVTAASDPAQPAVHTVLATHHERLRGSGAQPSAAHAAAQGALDDMAIDADDILGSCLASEQPPRSNGAAALTQREIDGFLSDHPLPVDADGDGHANDDFIFDLISRLEAGDDDTLAPPGGARAAGGDVPDLSHAEIDDMLREESFLGEDGSEGITADDLMEFSRSIADDAIDDLVDDDDDGDVCSSAAASRGDEASSVPRPLNGAGRNCSGTVAPEVTARPRHGRARAAGAKRTRRRALPAALVSMIEAGGEGASRVRAALVRSQRARKQNTQRAKRVKQSFLAGAAAAASEGTPAADAPVADAQSPAKAVNKPEVVRRAPLTVGERLASLHQGVLEARKEWHERVNLLQMLLQSNAKRKGAAAAAPNDVRLRAQRRGVEQATQAVLAASGALLLARAELQVSKLPEEGVYSCDVDGKMQVRRPSVAYVRGARALDPSRPLH